MINRDTVVASTLLVPGLITVGLAQLLGSMPGVSGTTQVIFLLLFSFVNVSLAAGVTHFALVAARKTATPLQVARSPLFVVLLTAISLATGVILALTYENAWINKLAQSVIGRDAGLTKVSGHSTLHTLLREAYTAEFPDYRHYSRLLVDGEWRQTRLLHVFLKDGAITVTGYKGLWSSSESSVTEIFLSPACVHGSDASATPVEGPGVYIPAGEIRRIVFIDENSAMAKCAAELRRPPATNQECQCER